MVKPQWKTEGTECPDRGLERTGCVFGGLEHEKAIE